MGAAAEGAVSTPFTYVIDAHPEDIKMVDYKRPKSGTPVMRTVADYRQLNDALFHAGLKSGSQFEFVDEPNRLQFYVIDLQKRCPGAFSLTPWACVRWTAPGRRSAGSPWRLRPTREWAAAGGTVFLHAHQYRRGCPGGRQAASPRRQRIPGQ